MHAHILSRLAAALNRCALAPVSTTSQPHLPHVASTATTVSSPSVLSRARKACATQSEAVSIVRTLQALDQDLIRAKLAFYLHNLGYYHASLAEVALISDEATASLIMAEEALRESIELRSLAMGLHRELESELGSGSGSDAEMMAYGARGLIGSYEQYGIVLKRMGRLREAVKPLEKAIQLTKSTVRVQKSDVLSLDSMAQCRADLARRLYSLAAHYLVLAYSEPQEEDRAENEPAELRAALGAAKESLSLRKDLADAFGFSLSEGSPLAWTET